MDALAIFIGILVAAGGAIWGVILLGNWFNHLSNRLRGHAFAALIWSLVTFFQTASLLSYREAPNVVGHLVLFVAGCLMVSSWAQFAERRRGASLRQDRRWLAHRLIVQSFWGPLALWAVVMLLCHFGGRLFDRALLRRDVTTALLLRHYGFGNKYDYEYHDRLTQVVEAGDLDGVSTYLASGIRPGSGYGRTGPLLAYSLRQENVAITRLLLRYGVSPEAETYWGHDHPLHTAVATGDIRHVQALLQNGADRKVLNNAGETPFQVAKQRNDKSMVAALTAKYPARTPPDSPINIERGSDGHMEVLD